MPKYNTPPIGNIKVGYEGPQGAHLYVIGEAPGQDEVDTGRPFIGRSGQYLRASLERAGMNMDNIRFLNLCQYRPRKNEFRHLLESEQLAEGLEQLRGEIETHKPVAILATGAWPLWFLTGEGNKKKKPGSGIGLWRGSILSYQYTDDDTKVIVSHHPAYIIRPQGYMWHPVFHLDVARAVKESKFRGIRRPQFEMYIDPPELELQALADQMNEAEWLTVDIENFPGQLSCVGFADSTGRALCLTYNHADRNWPVVQFLVEGKAKKILQNGRYDVDFLWHYYQWKLNNFAWDTLAASATLMPEFPRSLAFLCSIYTDFPYYKEDRKTWKESGDESVLWEYNCKDVIATHQIAMQQMREIQEIWG